MFQTNAELNHKHTDILSKDCVVERVIRLSGAEFDSFSHNLLREWDFLRDNRLDTVVDDEGRYHCLLVTGEGRRDGILVNTEGADYARYSTLIPHVEGFLAVGQYPALAVLNRRLTDIADYIAGQIGADAYVDTAGRLRSTVDLDSLDAMFRIEINETLLNTITDMLAQKPEIADWEIDNNELILYSKPEHIPADLSDPTVTRLDMNVYGYDFDGMVPLGKEKAFELYDAGYQIFRLYEDDSEGGIDERKEIEEFDGLFGIEYVSPDIRQKEADFEVLVLNWDKYHKGEQAGEWLPLPAASDTLRALLERIGVEGVNDSFTIANVRMPMHELLRDHISKHDSLDELNMLAAMWGDMAGFERDKLQAILTSGVHKIGYRADSIINTLCDENFDAFRMIDASNYESLGGYWDNENHDKPEELSLWEYGRQCVCQIKSAAFGVEKVQHLHQHHKCLKYSVFRRAPSAVCPMTKCCTIKCQTL